MTEVAPLRGEKESARRGGGGEAEREHCSGVPQRARMKGLAGQATCTARASETLTDVRQRATERGRWRKDKNAAGPPLNLDSAGADDARDARHGVCAACVSCGSQLLPQLFALRASQRFCCWAGQAMADCESRVRRVTRFLILTGSREVWVLAGHVLLCDWPCLVDPSARPLH